MPTNLSKGEITGLDAYWSAANYLIEELWLKLDTAP